jgi:hypothetical protein
MHRDTVPIDSFQNRYLFYRAFETTEDVFRCLKFCRGFFFVTKSRVADSIFDKLGVFVVCAELTRDSEQILTVHGTSNETTPLFVPTLCLKVSPFLSI